MLAVTAEKDRMVERATDTLYTRLYALDPAAENFAQQNHQLKKEFEALEANITVRTTLPVLQAFLQAHHLDNGLGMAPVDTTVNVGVLE